MTCPTCKTKNVNFTVRVGKIDCCSKCKDDPKAHKPKKKVGRPVTLTPEQRKANEKEAYRKWKENHRDHLRKYQRKYQAERRARLKRDAEE